MGTTLYRYFDSEGQLLYVGITGDNTKRQSQHRRSSFWFGEIAYATFEHFEERQKALEAEGKAIKDEKPLHNIAGKGIYLSHSPYVHMVFLAGMPDGGHDAMHEEFSRAYRKVFQWADGNMPTPDMVIALAMQFAKAEAENAPNLTKCSICVAAFSAEWFTDAFKAIKRMK
jgi:predicted GIY-YIG superfamily endonuclease